MLVACRGWRWWSGSARPPSKRSSTTSPTAASTAARDILGVAPAAAARKSGRRFGSNSIISSSLPSASILPSAPSPAPPSLSLSSLPPCSPGPELELLGDGDTPSLSPLSCSKSESEYEFPPLATTPPSASAPPASGPCTTTIINADLCLRTHSTILSLLPIDHLKLRLFSLIVFFASLGWGSAGWGAPSEDDGTRATRRTAHTHARVAPREIRKRPELGQVPRRPAREGGAEKPECSLARDTGGR